MARFGLFFLSFLVALAAIPLCVRLARRAGMIDQPTHRKIHSDPVPYLGGVAILLGLLAGAAAYLCTTPLDATGWLKVGVICGCTAAAALLGLIDDKFEIRPWNKFVWQLVIVTVFIIFGYHFDVIRIPAWGYLELNDLGVPFTVLWMLAVVNGMNLIDGIDGLAASVAAVALLLISVAAGLLPMPDPAAGTLALLGGGATLAFLVCNWRPARIYLGDAGSLGLGMLLATLLVAMGHSDLLGMDVLSGFDHHPDEPYAYQFGMISLVALYPLLEVTLTVFRRILRGKPIGSADRDHIHHRLLKEGWSAPGICIAAALLSFLGAGAFILALMNSHSGTAWLLSVLGVMIGAGLHFCGFLDMLRPASIRGTRPHFLIANHFTAMQSIKLEMVDALDALSALVIQTALEFGIEKLHFQARAHKQNGQFEFDWTRPEGARSTLLPPLHVKPGAQTPLSDHAELNADSRAVWTFEPNLADEDIEVEYRVLMSEFLTKALLRAEQLCGSGAT